MEAREFEKRRWSWRQEAKAGREIEEWVRKGEVSVLEIDDSCLPISLFCS